MNAAATRAPMERSTCLGICSAGAFSAVKKCGVAGRGFTMPTVDQPLNTARALLPHRFSPSETCRCLACGAPVIRRNVLEWRCDPARPWHHPLVGDYG